MRKPFWTYTRRRALTGFVCFVIAYVITAMFARAFIGSLTDAAWTSILPPVFGAVAGVIASTIARTQYVNWRAWHLRRKADEEITTNLLHWPMFWLLWDVTEKHPSLLVVLSAVQSSPSGVLPPSTSMAEHLTSKARSIVASEVWTLVPEDRRRAFVEALVRYPEADDPENLRKLFELGDFETTLAYLVAAQDSEVALRAMRSGIPVEYVKAAM